MTRIFPTNLLIILLFIGGYIFIEIISNYRQKKPKIEYESNNIRPSYGNEFYNYYGGDNNNEDDNLKDNSNEIIVEGFSFSSEGDAITGTHNNCPVMDGNETTITSCIHFPNYIMDGLPGSVDNGFLVSVCCDTCIDQIQQSLNNNNGEYNIIFEDPYYILEKRGVKKQVIFPCTTQMLSRITSLINTNNR